MTDFLYRTEDIARDSILSLYVPTVQDANIVESLKSANPIVLEGSRGTGKSFLLRVAQAQLLERFQADRVFPVYVSFVRSSLLHTDDPMQFRNWMLARLCSRIVRCLSREGLLQQRPSGLDILSGGAPTPSLAVRSRIDNTVEQYEQSYRTPGASVSADAIPDVEQLRDLLEDLCEDLNLGRIAVFFDEAAHIFRPEQQRQFFTMFRDLRAPFVTCNAAVYPGVTSYGPTFEAAHDATFIKISRDILGSDYIRNMREIVEKQAPSELIAKIDRNRANFQTLAYAVSGNPRLLLKTVARAARMRSTDIDDVIKDFYRSDIWAEHSSLGEKYAGYEPLIAWGRTFIEDTVLPDTKTKNDQWRAEARNQSTCFIWVHNDAPECVKHALRILEYTGIVLKRDSWVRSTRAEHGTRYSVNLGCLFAREANPVATGGSVGANLTPRRFTEYGPNHPVYASLTGVEAAIDEPDMSVVLERQLGLSIEVLDVTRYQKDKLREIGLPTVRDVLGADEVTLQQIYHVGPIRSRRMMNAATASVLEYLSG